MCEDQTEPAGYFTIEPQMSVESTDPYEHLAARFSYHAPHAGQVRRHQRIRAAALELAKLIEDMTPGCREQMRAIDLLDETVMWANAAIARNG